MAKNAIESPFCKRTNPNKQNYRIDMALQAFHTMEELLHLLPDCSEKRIRSHIKWLVDNFSDTCIKEEVNGKIRFILKDQILANVVLETTKIASHTSRYRDLEEFGTRAATSSRITNSEYVDKKAYQLAKNYLPSLNINGVTTTLVDKYLNPPLSNQKPSTKEHIFQHCPYMVSPPFARPFYWMTGTGLLPYIRPLGEGYSLGP